MIYFLALSHLPAAAGFQGRVEKFLYQQAPELSPSIIGRWGERGQRHQAPLTREAEKRVSVCPSCLLPFLQSCGLVVHSPVAPVCGGLGD